MGDPATESKRDRMIALSIRLFIVGASHIAGVKPVLLSLTKESEHIKSMKFVCWDKIFFMLDQNFVFSHSMIGD